MTALNGLEPAQWLLLSALLGLCIGSLLNVVAHRLPIMMQRAWDADLAEAQGREPEELPRFNLFLPASHCPACKTPLKAWHNIPVLSYLLLRGKCGHCSSQISMRYPVVELLCGGVFLAIASLNPPGVVALALMAFAASLLVLALIDLDTYLLPDSITLPLLWAGLLFNLFFDFVPLASAVSGAALGYLVLWLIYQLFKLATGKEGMGYGDFKLLAAIGAWLGVTSLFSVVLFASVSGIVFGLVIQTIRGKKKTDAFPFGPCLVMGALAWMAGFDLTKWI
ncbi:prepilin peptidase [Limnobacter alexandrii]|uniref:prepilin peptidase n=1 Tax=Limnobacter alexandrii TaxID=2570352 RepID=UPI0011088DF5|nr:A24 family peptidase [Limnobacter alexandrii]